jgi:hypothetical protein
LNFGNAACFWVKTSRGIAWSFFIEVSVVYLLRRLRASSMSRSTLRIASIRFIGLIGVRLSCCTWFGESRNCFCEHILYCVSVGKCGSGIRILSGVPQNFGMVCHEFLPVRHVFLEFCPTLALLVVLVDADYT